MFTVDRLSQFGYIGRVINEIDTHTYDYFAIYRQDDFVIKLRRLCYRFKLNDRLAFEMMVQIGTYKLCLRFECTRVNNWCDIYDIKVFGLHKERNMWSSVIVSPIFANHLEISKTILKMMFNRICTYEHMDVKYSHTIKGKFIIQIQQPYNNRFRLMFLACWRRWQMVSQFRNKHIIKRAWYKWLEHFYAPDTQNGYMTIHAHSWNHM